MTDQPIDDVYARVQARLKVELVPVPFGYALTKEELRAWMDELSARENALIDRIWEEELAR